MLYGIDTSDLDLLDTIKDTDENILIVNCKIDNTNIILGSVYGPNVDDNRSFFNKIDEFLNAVGTTLNSNTIK